VHAHKHEMSGPHVRPSATTLFLMVGLPGAGKTTVAQELAAMSQRGLRLTPDEWHLLLFGESLTADGKRDILEGRLITVALRTLRLGTSVVLDFGLWGRDERSALRWLADEAEVLCQLVYLPVELDVQTELATSRRLLLPAICMETGSGRKAHPPAKWSTGISATVGAARMSQTSIVRRAPGRAATLPLGMPSNALARVSAPTTYAAREGESVVSRTVPGNANAVISAPVVDTTQRRGAAPAAGAAIAGAAAMA
jgi:predicted kinase